MLYWGPVHNCFLAGKSNLMKISPCFNSLTGLQIAPNFGTCHDSCAVMASAKICSDHLVRIEICAKLNFQQIWIAMEKMLREMDPQTMIYIQSLHYIQSSAVISAVIMRSNIVSYYINNYRNWGRISIRCWIHKRHPIPHPIVVTTISPF